MYNRMESSGTRSSRRNRINLSDTESKAQKKKDDNDAGSNLEEDKNAETRSKSPSEDPGEGTSTSQGSNNSKKSASSPNGRGETSSPEPGCSICLGQLENKSFTDSCFHMFCFVCLLEWSKVKAVCPLCKQPFKSIIHNVRSVQDYDQYYLQSEENAGANTYTDPLHVPRNFRYRTTQRADRWLLRQQREQERQMRLLQRPSRMNTRVHWQRMRQAATSAFRSRIYANDMRVQPSEGYGNRRLRSRNISPDFFRLNEAQTHRLVPWLNRELNVLLNNHEDHVQFVMELILELIKRFEIQSEEMFQHIQAFTGARTEHFVHEFFNFACSPFDMAAYDRHAVYEEPELPVHTIDSSSSNNSSPVRNRTNAQGDDDDDVVILSPSEVPPDVPRPSRYRSRPADEAQAQVDHPYTHLNQPPPPLRNMFLDDRFDPTPLLNNLLAFANNNPMSQSGWESPSYQSGATGHLWATPIFPGYENVDMLPNIYSTSTNTTNSSSDTVGGTGESSVTCEINLMSDTDSSSSSSSDGSDLVIVAYEKPWESRSPVVLSSDNAEDLPGTSGSQKKSKTKRRKKRRFESPTNQSNTIQSAVDSPSPAISPHSNKSHDEVRSHDGNENENDHFSKSHDEARSNDGNDNAKQSADELDRKKGHSEHSRSSSSPHKSLSSSSKKKKVPTATLR